MARKLLLFHLLSFCCLLSANATGQIPDLIIIGKDTLMLLECPIEHDSILSRRVSERLSREGGIFADPDTIPEVTKDYFASQLPEFIKERNPDKGRFELCRIKTISIKSSFGLLSLPSLWK